MYTAAEKKLVSYTKNKVKKLFEEHPVSAHGIDHIARVVGLAKLLAGKEKADVFLSEMSGWLHDIGRTLEEHTNVISGHHELSYELCQKWFREDEILRVGLNRKQKLVILYSVRYHWNNAANKYSVAWILRDADKIDTFGLVGIKRGKEFAAGDDKKFDLDMRLRFDNFYWLRTKTAKKFVKDKHLMKQLDSFYLKYLGKKVKPVEL